MFPLQKLALLSLPAAILAAASDGLTTIDVCSTIIKAQVTSTVLSCATYSTPTLIDTVTATTTVHVNGSATTSTSVPVVTFTPPPIVTTTTIISIETVFRTQTASTDVFSTTETIFTTETPTTTSIFTETTTVVESSTASTSTFTVVPTGQFVPVLDTFGSSSYPSNLKREAGSEQQRNPLPLARRSTGLTEHAALVERNLGQNVAAGCVLSTVISTYTTVIYTTAPVTTTLPPSTSLVTTSSTITSTSVVVPDDVSVTSSFSTTSTVTDWQTDVESTTTTTTTTVVSTPVATVYAQCVNQRNYIGPQASTNNRWIVNAYPPESSEWDMTSGVESSYDCCNLCAQSPTCAATLWGPSGTGEANQCFLLDMWSVPSAQSDNVLELQTSDSSASIVYVVSNGLYGWAYDAGSQPNPQT